MDKNIQAEMALSGRLLSRGAFFFIMANCVFISREGMVFPSPGKRLKGTEIVSQQQFFLESMAEEKGMKRAPNLNKFPLWA